MVFAEAIKNDYMIQRIVLLARSRKIPVFCIEGHIDDTYYIGMDYHSGFEDLVRHVIKDHGARRVNMLAGFENNSFSAILRDFNTIGTGIFKPESIKKSIAKRVDNGEERANE